MVRLLGPSAPVPVAASGSGCVPRCHHASSHENTTTAYSKVASHGEPFSTDIHCAARRESHSGSPVVAGSLVFPLCSVGGSAVPTRPIGCQSDPRDSAGVWFHLAWINFPFQVCLLLGW